MALGHGIALPFNKGGLIVPSGLTDGNTAVWLDHLFNLTKDGSNRVSSWLDRIGGVTGVTQAGADDIKPTHTESTGVVFDGSNDYMSGTFTLNQPTTLYMVVKQISWTRFDYLFDGATSNKGLIYQGETALDSPGLVAYAGTASSSNKNLPVGSWGIIRIVFNGASSKFQVNETSEVAWNAGTQNMGGLTLGRQGATASAYGNVAYKEFICRRVAEGASDYAAIYNYLKAKYSL